MVGRWDSYDFSARCIVFRRLQWIEHHGFAYWLVYSVRYVDTVYVLHCCRQHPGEYKDLYAVKAALQAVELFKRGGST